MDDLISRNAALALVVKAIHGTDSEEIKDYLFGGLRKELWALPSAQPNLQPTCNQLATDVISRQDAIRWVKTECNPYGKPTLDFESGKKVIEHLGQMPSADRPTGWIPVSERLPEENGEYIASLEDSVYPWAEFFNGKWFMLSFDAIAREFGEYEVIAWMPLPKPYKNEALDLAIATLVNLPSADRPKGKWIPYLPEGLRYKCSECESKYDTPWHFCPNCGCYNGGRQSD